ncbi:rhodanese-like domain-containing protein [Candidatus Kapaibacterium sp.]
MNYKDISPEEFKKIIDENPDSQVIDCRTYPELMEFKLDYQHHIDIMQPNFMSKLANLDKSKKYLVYCRSGNRSAFLCDYMAKMGFNQLYNLDGGIISWIYMLRRQQSN